MTNEKKNLKNVFGVLVLFAILLFSLNLVSSASEPTQQFNKIFLSPFYVSSSTQNVNTPFTLVLNPPDKIGSVISAVIGFDVWINPSVNFTLLVNGQSCNNPSYYISTTYASAGKTTITFDCKNVITTSGTYSVILKANKDTGALTGWLDFTYINSPKGEVRLFGTEYQGGDIGTTFVQLLDANQKSINTASCFVSSYYPNKTMWWNNNVMTYLTGSEGLYYKDFISPNVVGVYMLSSTCYDPATSFTDDFTDFSKIQSYTNVTIIPTHQITLTKLTNSTGLKNPSAYNSTYAEWTNPQNAIGSNDLRATTSVTGEMNDWYNFNFSIPSESIINGIIVSLEGSTPSGTTGVDVEISRRGGLNYTATGYGYTTTSSTDAIRILGNSTDLWGRTDWTSNDFNSTNFRLRLTKTGTAGVNHRIDNILVNVSYTFPYSLARGDTQSIDINLTGYLWKNFSATYSLNGGNITFEVRNQNNVTLCTGFGDISNCANNTSPIRLYALLTTNGTTDNPPTLDDWKLTWLINGTIQQTQGSGELHITNYISGLNTSINNIQINHSAIAEAVWTYENRNLTYYPAINETSIASAIWGWTGSISSSILNFFSIAIWSAVNRTLTYYEDTTNYTKIGQYVWTYSDRNLTYYVVNNLSPEDVWNYASRNITFTEHLDTTNYTQIQNMINSIGDKTNYTQIQDMLNQLNLSDKTNYSLIASFFVSPSDLTNYTLIYELIENQTRIDMANYSKIAQYVWFYVDRNLTTTQTNNLTAEDVWNYYNRSLTQDIPMQIWSYTNRNLTTDIPFDVWSYYNRSLTYYTINLTELIDMINAYNFTDTPILLPNYNGNQIISYTLNVTLIVPA